MPRAGLTALIVAQARAVESRRPDRLLGDPFAAELVAAAGEAFPANSAEVANLLRLRGDYIAVRTRFFDEYLHDASVSGIRQVVLPGAGLDARAYRLTWPHGTTLFELDLPDVLAFKERALAARAATPACARIAVAADLSEDWPEALVAAGFRPGTPAAWLAEGVLMYFKEDERDRLLRQIGDLSAPGSRLGADQRGAAGQGPGGSLSDGGDESVIVEMRKAGDADAARMGVLIPGDRADPSIADPEAWFQGHGWQARIYPAAERFARYNRRVEPLVESATADLWLATAVRSPGRAQL